MLTWGTHHCLVCWDWMVGREEAGDHKAKVELWPHRQAFILLSGHPGCDACLPASCFCL